MKTALIKNTFLCISLCFLSVQAISQERSAEKRAQIEELRQKYINERLELNEEAQKEFDQVQEEFKAKMEALRASQEEVARRLKQEMRGTPKEDIEISEEDARKILMERLAKAESKAQLDRAYTEAMMKAISARKTLEYKRLEREFKRELIQMVKDDRQRHRMNEELRRRKAEEAESKPVEEE